MERDPRRGTVYRKGKRVRIFVQRFGCFIAYRTKRGMSVVFRSEWRKWAANAVVEHTAE